MADAAAPDTKRNTGKLAYFDRKKGFGFCVPEGGGTDIFVHQSNVESVDGEFPFLDQDVEITYTVGIYRGRPSAMQQQRNCDGSRSCGGPCDMRMPL